MVVLVVVGWERGDRGLFVVEMVVEVVTRGPRVAGRVGGDAEAGGGLDVGFLCWLRWVCYRQR